VEDLALASGANDPFIGVLAKADDDHKNVWFDTGLRGKTTRLVYRFVKPAE